MILLCLFDNGTKLILTIKLAGVFLTSNFSANNAKCDFKLFYGTKQVIRENCRMICNLDSVICYSRERPARALVEQVGIYCCYILYGYPPEFRPCAYDNTNR